MGLTNIDSSAPVTAVSQALKASNCKPSLGERASPLSPVFAQTAKPSLPPRTVQLGGEVYEVYDAAEQAAVIAIRRFVPESVAIDREFGGRICQLREQYLFSRPRIGLYAGEVEPSPCPDGTKPVARYHTHGTFGQEQPSGGDIVQANNAPNFLFYVGTPKGVVYRYQTTIVRIAP